MFSKFPSGPVIKCQDQSCFRASFKLFQNFDFLISIRFKAFVSRTEVGIQRGERAQGALCCCVQVLRCGPG